MLLAHLADLHLGYRAYGKTTDKGVNQRETDVAEAFKRAIDAVILHRPQLVVIAGDVFHSFRPSNANINLAFREFSRLRRNLSEVPLVIVAGNHDLPRSYDAGSILRLFENIEGCSVVDAQREILPYPELDCAITCVPSNDLSRYSAQAVQCHPDFRYNLLVLHGTIEGVIRQAQDPHMISTSELLAQPWDYIACGHYHTHHALAEHAYYSGSLERASSNVWEEAGDRKGFVLHDLARHEHRFVEIPGRTVVDLPAIDATQLEAPQVDEALRVALEQIDAQSEQLAAVLAGKVIRQVVRQISRPTQRQLDYKQIRQFRAWALHYELKLVAPQAGSLGPGEDGTSGSKSIRQEWGEFLDRAILRPGLDRPLLHAKGLSYLDPTPPDEERF